MKVILAAVLLLAATGVITEPIPQRGCQGVEQVIDTNCEGFLICRKASDNPRCEIEVESGNQDYVMCFYPCKHGKTYDYENRRCTRNSTCIY